MSTAYLAKWIISSNENNAVFEDCALLVDEGLILDIVKQSELEKYNIKKIKDYANCVITPGFVNLLSYLQSTLIGKEHKLSLKSKIKKVLRTLYQKYVFAFVPESNFSKRLSFIINEHQAWSRKDKLESFQKGLEMSLLAGTTCLVQISNAKKYFELANKSPLKTYIFFEIYADSSDKGKKEFKLIKNKIETLMLRKSSDTFIGVCPNSIANVHKKLWKVLSKYCRKHNLLMLMHLAESEDEMDWLKYGFSDIDLLHKFLGLKKLSPHTKGNDPVDYLNRMNVLSKKVIVANANYLTQSQMAKLSQSEAKFVYCPRFDDIVCSRKQSLQNVLKFFPERFGFGTDSLYNNKDLSILNEAKYVNEDNILDVCELIKYITYYPSKILRLHNIIGSLEKDKHADFNVFKLEANETYKDILKKTNPDFVYIKGKRLVDNKKLRSVKNR